VDPHRPAEQVWVVLLLRQVVADLVHQLRRLAERLVERLGDLAADQQPVRDRVVAAGGHRVLVRTPIPRLGLEVTEVHLALLERELLLRDGEEVLREAVAEATRTGVEHHPQPLAVRLQLDEVIAAAQAAELVLAAPRARVLGDVPGVVDRDAVALRGARSPGSARPTASGRASPRRGPRAASRAARSPSRARGWPGPGRRRSA